MLTAIVPFRNGHKTLGRLLDSLPRGMPVVVVDDQSNEPLQLDRDDVSVIRPATRGYFSGAVNVGIQATQTDVLVLNQDIWLEGDGWLAFVLVAQAEGYAIAGDGVMKHPAWPKGYVQGTFMYLSRPAINQVGLLNERDYPLWGATAEWQLRACRLGFKALPVKPVPGLHHERAESARYGSSISRLLQEEPEKRDWYIRTPPAVSAVIPCYNQGRYLVDAIHSLIGGPTSLGDFPPQSFQSFEIVIVDDGSTDDSAALGEALADDWRAIRFLRLERNRGKPAALNMGIRQSFGQSVTVLDADDMREPWSLEALYQAQEANPHAMIYDDAMYFGAGKRGIINRLGQKIDHFPLPNYDFDTLLEKNQAHTGILFPRQAWRETGGYPELMNRGREDWAFNIALGIKGYCGIHLARPGYLYRREGQGRTIQNTTPEWRDFFLNQLMGLYPDIYKGGRPVGCCGTKKQAGNGNGNGASRMAQSAEPREGMTLIEYSGKSQLRSSYWGVVTHTRYQFGKSRALGYVRNPDVEGILAHKEDGRIVFSLAQASQPQTESALANKVLVPMTSGPAAVAVPTDPGDMTIAELEAYLVDQTTEQLAALLDAEKADKNRKGAIALIEALLYEDQEDTSDAN